MSQRSDRIAAALRLERMKHTKAVERFNDECQLATNEVVADQSRRGILQSGITGSRLMQVERLRAENILNDLLNLRRESISRVPEMASAELFKGFADELQHTAERLAKAVPQRLGSRMGGVVQIEGGSPLPRDLERTLKAMVRREIDIMQQESELEVGTHSQSVQPTENPRRVFVVHGRNGKARDAMFTFLRSIDLEPIEWSEAVSLTGEGSPFNGQVLEKAFAKAKAVVVLITGDDLARLGTRFQQPEDEPGETELTPQARPNVLFEAGMAFGRHPERTILVRLGHGRQFSDVAGRNEVRITNRSEDRHALVTRLRTAGCAVKTDGKSDWLSAGDFDGTALSPDKESGQINHLNHNNPELSHLDPRLSIRIADARETNPLRSGIAIYIKNVGGSEAHNLVLNEIQVGNYSVEFTGSIAILNPGDVTPPILPRVKQYGHLMQHRVDAAMLEAWDREGDLGLNEMKFPASATYTDFQGNKFGASWTYNFLPLKAAADRNRDCADDPCLFISSIKTRRLR